MVLIKAVHWCKNHSSVINTKSEDEYNTLMDFLEQKGYKWNTGAKLSDKNVYDNYGKETCINIDKHGNVFCDCATSFKGVTIIKLRGFSHYDKILPKRLRLCFYRESNSFYRFLIGFLEDSIERTM